MKRLCVGICIAVLLVAGCGSKGGKKAGHSSIIPVYDRHISVGKPHREAAGFVGPVHTVREETNRLPKHSKGLAKWRRSDLSITTYSRDDDILKDVSFSYCPDGSEYGKRVVSREAFGLVKTYRTYTRGSLNYRAVTKYNLKGKPVGLYCYTPNKKLKYRWESKYNRQGDLIQRDIYKQDKSLDYGFKIKYSSDGRVIELTCYDSAGMFSREVYIYGKGNARESRKYNSKGKLESYSAYTPLPKGNGYDYKSESYKPASSKAKLLRRYDAKWNLLSETLFNPSGNVDYKLSYSYKYDSRGNWIRKTTSLMRAGDGNTKPKPVEVTRRRITYY
ncbi:MAG: hypothetical protein Q7N50_06845 [Armatimonadota bacterium]|nr:hypothetical protein [Armatimonadota bacterium]